MPATVMIADKNVFLLEALENTLSLLGFTVVVKTTDKSNIETLALRNKPDLLLYDMHLTDDRKAGLIDLKRLKGKLPEMKTLVSGFYDVADQFVEEILNAGIEAFWSKSDNRESFMKQLGLLFPEFP